MHGGQLIGCLRRMQGRSAPYPEGGGTRYEQCSDDRPVLERPEPRLRVSTSSAAPGERSQGNTERRILCNFKMTTLLAIAA